MRVKLVILVVVLLMVLFGIIFIFSLKQNEKKEKIGNENFNAALIEFLPLTLCKNTEGNWKAVNATEFPLNSEQGVYNPSTNKEINYKCFCPAGQKWSEKEGCK